MDTAIKPLKIYTDARVEDMTEVEAVIVLDAMLKANIGTITEGEKRALFIGIKNLLDDLDEETKEIHEDYLGVITSTEEDWQHLKGNDRSDKFQTLLNYTMERMEKEKFAEGEAEMFADMLGKSIKENSKLHEFNKPFTVFRFP